MSSPTSRPAFSGLARSCRSLRRDADALRRIAARTAAKQCFRALSLLGRVALKAEEQVQPSEVVWSDSGEEVVDLPRPRCNREPPAVISRRIGRYTLQHCFVALNRKVRLIPPGPVPFDADNRLLAYALRPKHYRNPFVHVPLTALLRSLRGGASGRGRTLGQACLLTNAWNRTYHHWVGDLLPQIVILEEAGLRSGGDGLKFVLPASPARWQLESLELMGVPASALVQVNVPTLVEQLFVPSFARRDIVGGGWSIISPRILRQLRDRFYARCGVDTTTPPALKVYISRRMALGRRVINEVELEQALTRLGFRIVATEALSYADEVRLFADARVVVGPAGSGLTNVTFCRGQADVVEIAADGPGCPYPDSTTYSLTAGLGHRFSTYLAQPVRRLAPTRFDLVVDVEDFCRFLQDKSGSR